MLSAAASATARATRPGRRLNVVKSVVDPDNVKAGAKEAADLHFRSRRDVREQHDIPGGAVDFVVPAVRTIDSPAADEVYADVVVRAVTGRRGVGVDEVEVVAVR